MLQAARFLRGERSRNGQQLKYIVAGAGLFGSVIAERIASVLGQPVEVFEKRDHIGGNCHSFRDAETGIECHAYGTHIFHTQITEVWDYINQFTKFNTYRHKVLASHAGQIYQMPVNLGTINALYDTALPPEAAKALIRHEASLEAGAEPANLEEKAISLVGRRLYEAFIKNYTAKQWQRDPRDLPAGIITRLPVRFNYNAEYFDDYWQGLPLDGYDAMFRNLLANPLITVHLNSEYRLPEKGLTEDTVLIYTGMPDELFNYRHGPLAWRSLRFDWERPQLGDFQGTSVINYTDKEPIFTRIHEFRHLHPERQEAMSATKTVICKEYPADYVPGGEAYYPVNDSKNNEIYARYQAEAGKIPGLLLGGRLGAYKYWNMDLAIANALKVFRERILPNAA